MVLGSKVGEDIFKGEEDIIVFAINKEGFNDSGFAGKIAKMGWPELANFGEHELGEVFIKEINGKKYCGIVCHSLEEGWGEPEKQTEIIKKCFDNIVCEPSEEIASIAIGNGLMGQMTGANYPAIVKGMKESTKNVILYGVVPEMTKEEKAEMPYMGVELDMPDMPMEEPDMTMKSAIEVDKYTDIEQLISDIEGLGDWKDPSQRDSYLKIVSKILSIYHGYELENGKKNIYPKEVIRAIADVCSKKFPSKNEVFIDGKLRPGMPDNEYSNYITLATTPLGISFLGERTRIDEVAKEKFGIDVYHTQLTEEEAERLIESSKQYLNQNIDKLNIPYYQVAKEALMNWNGLSEEEAIKILNSQSFEEIEGQVWAKGSMDYAIEAISESLALTDINKEEISEDLSKAIYEGKEVENLRYIIKFRIEEADQNSIIMDTLFKVHDGWVKDNQKKFMARDKKHQHMPSELIGWKEAKADLLFIKPIFEAAGIEIDEQALEAEYNNRVKEFFLDRKIMTSRNLSDSITQGEEFYPALANYGDVLSAIKDPDYVDQHVIPAIEQKGIGRIEDVRKNIVAQIVNNPTAQDIERLSESEKIQVEQALEQEVEVLTAERDELRQKNAVIQRIVDLAKKRSEIKKEILLEEQKKNKNIQDLNE